MKSTIKLTLTSLLLFFSFTTIQAAVVETDTVMAQNYIETNQTKSQYIESESITSNNLTVRTTLTLMPDRASSTSTDFPPKIILYSIPYQTATTLQLGFEDPADASDPSIATKSASLSAKGGMGNDAAMNFHAAEYNFDFNNTNIYETGIMNVNGKIVCKKEIRVTEVNTDKINTKGINAKEINVEMGHAADYVFDEEYDLKSLGEVEEYVKKNKHLPGVPSASEFKENGMNVSETSNLLLEKIEELTLYMIRLQKEVEQLKEENNALRNGAKQ